jgi:hypothetical protein
VATLKSFYTGEAGKEVESEEPQRRTDREDDADDAEERRESGERILDRGSEKRRTTENGCPSEKLCQIV